MSTPKCSNCRNNLAYGVFRMTPTRGNTFLTNLCADCGFNIINKRVSRVLELPRELHPPGRAPFVRMEEVRTSRAVYRGVVLVEPFYKSVSEIPDAKPVSAPRVAPSVRRAGSSAGAVMVMTIVQPRLANHEGTSSSPGVVKAVTPPVVSAPPSRLTPPLLGRTG